MTQDIHVLRIGPLPGAAKDQSYLFVPVISGNSPEDIVNAGDDTAALEQLRANFPNAYFICDPEMELPRLDDAEVANSLTPERAELRADLAVGLSEDERLPVSRPMALRRMLLFASGPFLASFSAERLLGARKALVSVEGEIANRVSKLVAVVTAREESDGYVATFHVEGAPDIDVLLRKLTQDSPARAPLLYAYGTDFIPTLIAPRNLDEIPDIGLFYMLAGASLYTLSRIVPGSDSVSEGIEFSPSVRAWTEVEIVSSET